MDYLIRTSLLADIRRIKLIIEIAINIADMVLILANRPRKFSGLIAFPPILNVKTAVIMAILAVFPNSLIVSSKLDTTPYISLDMQLNIIFTIGGANSAPPNIINRKATKNSHKDVVESRKAKGIKPSRVIEMPAIEMR
jgi:hypothetical protein